MCNNKYFTICLFFSVWTIVQTSFHLIFVISSYFMSICLKSPSQAVAIFFYFTYLFNKECREVSLEMSNSFSLEKYFFTSFVKYIYADDTTVSLEEIVSELIRKREYFPDYGTTYSRSSLFLLCFLILDGAWTISAVALLMGVCFGIKQSVSLIFYTPWLVMTACVSTFDATASIIFGLDIIETTNFINWLKFVGVENEGNFSNLDAKSPSRLLPMAPTIMFFLVSSRFVIIWITNVIGFFFVLKATISVYKESYKNELKRRRNMLRDSPLNRQVDLNSSAARIRNWQLFYGAIETTSSAHSSESDKDLNCNNKEVNGNSVNFVDEGQTLEVVPTVSSSVSRNYYYAYSDVAESIDGGDICMNELRSQLPWTYFASDKGENKQNRNIRLKSDSSSSGTEL